MSMPWRYRIVDHWPLEPGDGSVLVLSALLGVVWGNVALALVLDVGVHSALEIDRVGDIGRIPVLLPWYLLVFGAIALKWIGYAPDSFGIELLIAASGAVPGVFIGLLGVVRLHRG